MAKTRTGGFPIGFRSLNKGWQQDIGAAAAFAVENGFEAVDARAIDPAELRKIADAGLRIGSVDLMQWPDLASADGEKRKKAVEANTRLARAAAALGVRNFFAVAVPEQPEARRTENFARVVDGFGSLCEAIAPLGARVVLEGWPGPANSAIACTPADMRALLKEIPRGLGINYDPSHLIRMGIDAVRFLDEFSGSIFHVHAKDTEIMDEELYEHGHLQDATFAKQHRFGGFSWRYAIPGHGCARWGRMLSGLKAAGYDGVVSVELEDEDFNGSEEGERQGLIASRSFLENA